MLALNLIDILVIAGAVLVGLLVLGMILARLYKRATKEVSFVRTGFRGEKVIMNGGALVQVSRLSNPLVNELVIGLADKDKFNSSQPADDGQFADYVTHPTLPALLNILFRDAVNSTLGTNIADLAPSNFPRADLVAAFLTGVAGVNQLAMVTPSEMLRLNTAIPATPAEQQSAFGVAGDDLAGFPNGRRPGDDEWHHSSPQHLG